MENKRWKGIISVAFLVVHWQEAVKSCSFRNRSSWNACAGGFCFQNMCWLIRTRQQTVRKTKKRRDFLLFLQTNCLQSLWQRVCCTLQKFLMTAATKTEMSRKHRDKETRDLQIFCLFLVTTLVLQLKIGKLNEKRPEHLLKTNWISSFQVEGETTYILLGATVWLCWTSLCLCFLQAETTPLPLPLLILSLNLLPCVLDSWQTHTQVLTCSNFWTYIHSDSLCLCFGGPSAGGGCGIPPTASRDEKRLLMERTVKTERQRWLLWCIKRKGVSF